MKKFKPILIILCFALFLTIPAMSYAADDDEYGEITANNVILRSDYDLTGIGQVNDGDRFLLWPTGILEFNGNDYCKVEMLSGQCEGKIGWVAMKYAKLDNRDW